MAKFKVGDRVMIRDCPDNDYFNKSMRKYVGKTYTIDKVYSENKFYRLRKNIHRWHESLLELVLTEEQCRLFDLAKAIKLLKDECDRHDSCVDCPLHSCEICGTDYEAPDWSYPEGIYEKWGVFFIDIAEGE